VEKTSGAIEVCVVGGGPAGSTISAHLARLGHSVALIEARSFPRPHVGESLAPGIAPLLERAGVLAAVERSGALRAGPAVVRWGSRNETKPIPEGRDGFQVDRGVFDQILVAEARNAGVRVIQPARVFRRQSRGLNDWRVTAVSQSGESTVRAAFVVDACGRTGLLPGRKRRLSAPTLALYAYWREIPLSSLQSYVEAGRDHWLWAAPLPGDCWNISVFASPRTVREGGDHEATYRRLLDESTLLEVGSQARQVTPVQVCCASPRVDEEAIGNDWIKVGEAAFATDPLSSQGVQTAISQGFVAASVVHALLDRGGSAELGARFYADRIRASVAHHDRHAPELYEEHHQVCPTRFWAERSAAGSPRALRKIPPAELPGHESGLSLSLSPLTEITSVPVLLGDLIGSAQAVHHPNLDHPVAFLGGTPIEPLLAGLREPASVDSVLSRWSLLTSPSRASAALSWFWSRGILESPG
jgi:flavin-dependent dehydrogenase